MSARPTDREHRTVVLPAAGAARPVVHPAPLPVRALAAPGRGLTVDVGALLEPPALRALGRGLVTWLVALLAGGLVVAYLLGPLFATRDQRAVSQELQLRIAEAVGAAQSSLGDPPVAAPAPAVGEPVALLQVPRLRLQQVVSEGTDAGTLRAGPGHVPGTAGVGQPGNTVLVGRATSFGGPFGELARLRAGDELLLSTEQGQSVYTVTSVERRDVDAATYAATTDDRLTLLTSDRWWPLNRTRGLVVSAELTTAPFVPTAANGATATADGRSGDGSAWPLLVLELLALSVVVAVTSVLYRTWSGPATYLVSTPALLALITFTWLTGVRLLPGWF